MTGNKNLHAANKAKNDEFYTCLTDIEKELKHYREHFNNKTIFCNCDDPEYSNFWRYFSLNFDHLNLKRLISTHYETEKSSYMQEIYRDENGVHKERKPLQQNGDFRSPESIALLHEADIVVTNPPFSLFREYVAQLIEYDKKFLIIGNVNAITYKEIFPLIRCNRLWLGPSISSGDRQFYVPDNYPLNASNCGIDKDGRKFIRVKGVRWFTNLSHQKRNESIILYKTYNPDDYPKYDNYNAINVDKVTDIPCDYDGVMGVPITFLDKYNPEQFEIIGLGNGAELFGPAKIYENPIMIKNKKEYNGNAINRVLVYPAKGNENTIYKADNAAYLLVAPYARILINKK